MTRLESKANRDARGINTYERGLLYATLLLIASNISLNNTKPGKNNPYYEAIKFSIEHGKYIEPVKGEENQTLKVDPAIIIEAHLPYNAEAALKAGGNYFEHIEGFDNIDPNPLAISIEPDPSPFITIKNDPSWINSLEKYMVWIAMTIEYQTYYYGDEYPRTAGISFVNNSNEKAFVKIDAKLPYDQELFLQKRNLLSAVSNYPLDK